MDLGEMTMKKEHYSHEWWKKLPVIDAPTKGFEFGKNNERFELWMPIPLKDIKNEWKKQKREARRRRKIEWKIVSDAIAAATTFQADAIRQH